jgi:hypothetical protein
MVVGFVRRQRDVLEVLLEKWGTTSLVPLLSKVVVSVESVDVLVVPFSIRDVTWTTATSEEHRRLNVEITPSVQQLRNVISEFAHARLSTSTEGSPRWSVFGQWWQRLLGEIVDGEDSDVAQSAIITGLSKSQRAGSIFV